MKTWLCDNLDLFCSVTEGSENYSRSAPEIHGGEPLFLAFLIIGIVLLLISEKKNAKSNH